MTSAVSEFLSLIGRLAEREHTPAYVVGGFVRDELLGHAEKKDLDIVVVGSGCAFARAFEKELPENSGTLIEFSDFDTARFVVTREVEEKGIAEMHIEMVPGVGVREKIEPISKKKEVVLEIEFAGARSESYHNESRKPHVRPATIEEDLSRRDFTVNAMARQILVDGGLGPILDPFGGQADLEHRLLRTPLDPNETFSDDPLRMMRAARFSAQLIFEIESKSYLAIKKNAPRLKIISAERIQEELLRLLGTVKPSVGLWILYKTELFDQFVPEIADLAGVEEMHGYSHKDNLSHTFAVVDTIAEHSPKSLLRLAGLLHDIAKPNVKQFVKGRGWTFDMHEHLGKKMALQICRRLRISEVDAKYIAHLVRWHLQPIALMDKGVTDTAVRRLIVSVGDPLKDLLILCRADITTGNQKRKEQRLKNYDYLDRRIDEIFEKDKLRAFQSPVKGDEIMAVCELKAGPTVGRIKEAIEEAILEGEIPNEYEPARAYFEKIKGRFLEEAESWERRA